MFLKGLQEGGIPIKFSSWHTFIFNTGNTSNLNLQIQERSRSVKALFACQRRAPYNIETDSGAMFFCSSSDKNVPNTLQSYQFRIGGRYFPAAPVQTSEEVGAVSTNGGAEAFIELQKALNIVGDYRLSTGCNTAKWAMAPFALTRKIGDFDTYYSETDYVLALTTYDDQGRPYPEVITYAGVGAYPGNTTPNPNTFCGNLGSSCFAMAIDLETSNGVEISGLNAEEQSDISLIATYARSQEANFNMEVYCYYDAMVILRENNVLELIQ
jgi:hypothetical protein